MKYNKGFMVIGILLATIIILVVGGVVYYSTNNSDISKNENTGTCGPNGMFCVKENNPPADQNQNPPIVTTNPDTIPVAQKDYKILCKGDSVCLKYFDIWKKEQFSRNGYSESYFNKHIIPEEITILKWNSGESFYIIYNVNIDWASIKTADSFLVKLSPNEDTYQYLNLPKDTYLDESNVDVVIDKLAFNSTFTIFKPIDSLFYKSKNDTLGAINTKAGKGFDFSEIRFIAGRPLTSGTVSVPIFTAHNETNCSVNKLKVANVNLVTGEITISGSVCYMN
ncbi:MAG: hypothetical protein WAV23_00760 [Minisyncoccia bacterium]